MIRPDQIETTLTDPEALLLQALSQQMSDVFSLAADYGVRREDPAIARLFPDAYSNPSDADEFRRLTLDDAAAVKHEHQAVMAADLESVATTINGHVLTFPPDHVRHWLAGLTDIRIMVFERREQATATDPDTAEQVTGIYDWLGFMQGSLLEAIANPAE